MKICHICVRTNPCIIKSSRWQIRYDKSLRLRPRSFGRWHYSDSPMHSAGAVRDECSIPDQDVTAPGACACTYYTHTARQMSISWHSLTPIWQIKSGELRCYDWPGRDDRLMSIAGLQVADRHGVIAPQLVRTRSTRVYRKLFLFFIFYFFEPASCWRVVAHARTRARG